VKPPLTALQRSSYLFTKNNRCKGVIGDVQDSQGVSISQNANYNF